MDSSSIVVILARGRFKGKSEAIKSKLSKVFFFLSCPYRSVSLHLVTLIKLEVQYLFLLCLRSVVHL